MNCEAPSRMACWSLVRVVPQREEQVVLLSGDWVRLSTHFFDGTVLCPEGDDCPLCELLPVRPYWYLPCLRRPGNRPSLLELTALTCSDFEQCAKFAGVGVRCGLTVILTRKSKRSPVRCEVGSLVSSPRSASLHEWVSPLMKIFGFPPLSAGESLDSYSKRIRPSALRRAELVAGRMRARCGERGKSRQGG